MVGQNSAFGPNRLLAYYDDILKLRGGEIPPPRMAIVYPSYLCNQNCEYCMYAGEHVEYGSKMFTRDEFLKAIDTLHKLGVRGIEFCGGGEPTLNSHLAEASQYAIGRGIKLGLLTNGTAISDELENIIMKDYSYIRMSIDSFDKKIYIAKRRPKNIQQFDMAMSRLMGLGTKRTVNSKLMVGAKILLTGDCVDAIILEIDRALEMCAAWKPDSLQIKVAEDRGAPISSVFKYADVIEKYIDSRRSQYNFHIGAGLRKTTIKEQCWLNPLQLTVDSWGNAYLCCYFQHRKESHLLCNIFKDDLLSIWGSEEHKKKIKQIKPSACNIWNCRFHNYHRQAKDIVDDVFQLQFV